MPKRLFEQVADWLRAELKRAPAADPPSVTALARAWRISFATARKAVRLLADEGVVGCFQGAGLHAANDPRRALAPPAPRPVDRLHGKLRGMILDGGYRAGEFLPKIGYFALDEHVSEHTVIAALRRLRAEGLAHKQGRRWIVGPAKGSSAPARPPHGAGEQPVVVLLASDEDVYQMLFSSSHLIPFFAALHNEASKHDVRLTLALEAIPDRNQLPGVPAGKRAVRQLIGSLGGRYQGTLIVYHPDATAAVRDWIGVLVGFRRPVVYFNFTNADDGLSRSMFPSGGVHLYRPHLDEPAAAELALRFLVDRGHTTIGLPVYHHDGYVWAARRVDTLLECAGRCLPAPRIVTADETRSLLNAEPNQTSMRTLDRLLTRASSGTPGLRVPRGAERWESAARGELRRELFKAAPGLVSLLRDREVTAIVALNNRIAQDYYLWFRAVGVEIPRDLSLISFDNTLESITFPITTVDFGFSQLGYLAAHLFIGDMPVRSDAGGNIPGTCAVIDLGSVGPPRTRPIRLQM